MVVFSALLQTKFFYLYLHIEIAIMNLIDKQTNIGAPYVMKMQVAWCAIQKIVSIGVVHLVGIFMLMTEVVAPVQTYQMDQQVLPAHSLSAA